MKVPIRILCRTDIDWESAVRAERSETRAGHAARMLPRPSLAPTSLVRFLEALEDKHILDVWDEFFDVDLITLRYELNRISQDNLSLVRDARLTVGLHDFPAWYERDEDEMIYPIDDDDYFHPDLAGTAPNVGDETAIVFWPHIAYTYDDSGSPTLAKRPVRTLLSNNWGVRKSFLKEQFTEQEARRILTDHAYAALEVSRRFGCRRPAHNEHWWDVELRAERARFLSQSYGVSLVHVGSLLRLRAALDSDRVGVFAEHMGKSFAHFHLGESAEVPLELKWTEPWIRRAEQVFTSLRA
jgi:hypothetical protein